MLDSLEHIDNKRYERLEKMHTQWTRNVFNKVQDSVAEEVNKTSVKEADTIRNESYQEFLDAVNTKGGIYLDNADPDYDPLASVSKLQYKAKTGVLKDPALQLTRKHDAEEELLNPGSVSKTLQPKEMLNPVMWAEGKIESTPHGRYAKFINKPASELGKGNSRNRSTFEMSHFKIAKGREVVDAEFGKPKRTYETIRKMQGLPPLPTISDNKYVTNYLSTTMVSYK